MKNLRISSLVGAALVAGSVMTATTVVPGAATAAEVEGPSVKWLAGLWGTRRGMTEGVEYLSAQAKEKTDGAFDISLQYGGALAGPFEVLEGIESGAFEVGIACTAFAAGKLPLLSGLELPFIPADTIEKRRALQEAYMAQPEIVSELEKWNAVALASVLLPNYQVMGRGKPPVALADYDGLRLNSTGQVAEAMRLLGVSVSSSPTTDLYQAMERGVIDGMVYPFTGPFFSNKWNEIAEWYTTNLSPGSAVCFVLANKDAYDSLPDQYKGLLADLRSGALDANIAEYKKEDDVNLPILAEDGVQPITYTAEELAGLREMGGQPIWTAWAEAREAEGLPGDRMLEMILTDNYGN